MPLELDVQAIANVGPMVAGLNAAASAVAGSTEKMSADFASLAETTAASAQTININIIKAAATTSTASVSVAESTDLMKEKLRELASEVRIVQGGFSGLLGGFGALAGAGILGGFVIHFIEQANEAVLSLNHLSVATGISVGELSGLKREVEAAGGSFSGLETGLIRFTRAVSAANQGDDQMIAAFRLLGVEFRDLQNKTPIEILVQLASRLRETGDTSDDAAELAKIFGRSWAQSLPALIEASEKIQEITANGQELSGVITADNVPAAQKFQQGMTALGEHLKEIGFTLLKVVVPALQTIATAFVIAGGVIIDVSAIIITSFNALAFTIGFVSSLMVNVLSGNWAQVVFDTKAFGVQMESTWGTLWQSLKNTETQAAGEIAAIWSGTTEKIRNETKNLSVFEQIALGHARVVARLASEFKPPAARGAETSRIPALQAEFDQSRIIEGVFHTASLGEEVAYWNNILATIKLSLKDRERLELEQAKRREKIQNEENKQKEELAKTEVKTDRDMFTELLKIVDEGNKALKKGIDERIETEKKAAKERQTILLTDLGITRDHDLAALEIEQNHVETLANLGIISQKDRLAALQRFEDERFQIELQAAVERANLVASDPVAFEQALARIEEIYNQHNITMGKLADDAVTLQKRPFDNFFSTIQSSFQGMLQGILQGTQTIMGAVRNIFQSIIATIVNSFIKMGLQWLSTQLFMAATGKAIKTASAKEDAFTDAKAAGKGAFKSVMKHVPYPLNFILAPAAAAAAFSAVLAFDKGGVLGRDALGLLHKNEMVLPAHLSEGLQRMISSTQQTGGGPLGPISVTNHFSAVDEEGMRGLIQRHGLDLAQEVIRQIKLGAVEVPN